MLDKKIEELGNEELGNELLRLARTDGNVFKPFNEVPSESLGNWGRYQYLVREAKKRGYWNFEVALNFLELSYAKG